MGTDRLFLPSDPQGSFRETANCRCSIRYYRDPNAPELPSIGSGSFIYIGGGRAYLQSKVNVVLQPDIRQVRIAVTSIGNNLTVGRKIPKVGRKRPKGTGNAATVKLLRGSTLLEEIKLLLEIGQPKTVMRTLRVTGLRDRRILVQGVTFAPVEVYVFGSTEPAQQTIRTRLE